MSLSDSSVSGLRSSVCGLIVLALNFSSCGWIQSLRRDVEDEDAPVEVSKTAEQLDWRDPANRYAPPPPANVEDSRIAPIAGTPVDLSGTRARKMRMTASDFAADNLRNENSLWSEEGQGNYFFSRNRLRMPGDVVTVRIEDGLRKDMVDAIRKLLPPEYRDQDIRVPGLTKDKPGEALPAQQAASDAGQAATAPAQAQAAPAAATPAPGGSTGEADTADILNAEVLERYPNGNVRLRGIKRVPFKRQVRNIEVVAIVRGAEIGEDDQVKSSKFFDEHVEVYR